MVGKRVEVVTRSGCVVYPAVNGAPGVVSSRGRSTPQSKTLTITASCVYFYSAACGPKGHGSGLPLPSRAAAGFHDPILAQTEIIDPSRAPQSPAP